MSIFDAVKASYAIDNYEIAAESLAQTTIRAEIGKIELDRAFSGRNDLNRNIIIKLDEITEAWGLKLIAIKFLILFPPLLLLIQWKISLFRKKKKSRDSFIRGRKRNSNQSS